MAVARLKRIIQSCLGERGSVIRSIVTLVGGTAFAQGLALLALPLLTRLYTPVEFNVLAVYASLLAILSVAACLRLEIAIPLPERDEDAAALLILALTAGLGSSLLVGLLVLSFHSQIAIWLRVPELGPYVWLIPVGMWAASAYAAVQFWSTRKRKFMRIASTRAAQALGGVGIQVGTGAFSGGSFGLLLGHLVSSGAGFVGLARDAWQRDRHVLRNVSSGDLRRVMKQYSRFPTYSTAEALANTAAMQLPIIFIAALAAGPEAGFLLLATRVMAAPMALVGGATAQVYLAHASEEMRSGRLGDFTARILTGLLKVGVGPLLFVGIVAGPSAGIIFGSQWARVGELITWMTPWFILQFLSSPVSMAMYVVHRQRLMMALQLFGLVLRITAIWAAVSIAPTYLAEYYALSGAVFYVVCCLVYYRVAKTRWAHVFAALQASLAPMLGWLLAAMSVRFLISAV